MTPNHKHCGSAAANAVDDNEHCQLVVDIRLCEGEQGS